MIALDAVKDGKVMEQIQAVFRAGFKMTVEIKSVLGRNSQISSMLFFEKKGKELIAHDESPAQGKLLKG